MADVQVENGFTRIANSLLEALIGAQLPGSHLAVALAIARRTFGWNRSAATIRVSEIAEATGLHARSVQRALADLEAWAVLTRAARPGRPAILAIQKDFDAWALGDTANARQLRPRTPGVHATPRRARHTPTACTPPVAILSGKDTRKKDNRRAPVDVVDEEIRNGWPKLQRAVEAYGGRPPRELTPKRLGLLRAVARSHPERKPALLGAMLVHGFMVSHEKHGKGFDPVRRLRLPTLCGPSCDDYLEECDAALRAGRRPPFTSVSRVEVRPALRVVPEEDRTPERAATPEEIEATRVLRELRRSPRFARRFPNAEESAEALRAAGLHSQAEVYLTT